MGSASKPLPAGLVSSIIYRDSETCKKTVTCLESSFGPGRLLCDPLSFDKTDYYKPEMGSPLFRVFWMAQVLFDRDRLADIKNESNKIEKTFSDESGLRSVNLDPGLLSAENFILATTKNFSHRVYLRDGIFADLTLVYKNGGYAPLEWTYPDYADLVVRNILKSARDLYIRKPRRHSPA